MPILTGSQMSMQVRRAHAWSTLPVAQPAAGSNREERMDRRPVRLPAPGQRSAARRLTVKSDQPRPLDS